MSKNDLNIQVPLNVVSFGQVSISLLKEFYKNGYQPCLFPIGPIELGSYSLSQDFVGWIQSCLNKSIKYYKRSNPLFKLWHIHDSISSISTKSNLYTFYELDSPTEEEINICNNNDKIFFSSSHAASIFQENGVGNCSYIPLGFDKNSFFPSEKPTYPDGRIVFNILGKLERRKHHLKMIRAWLKKYGNNHKYFLQCAIWNPFFKPEELENLYAQILDGKNYFNIKFYPFFPSNFEYNQFINSCDIVLAMSGGEGWGLPEFHSVALGKHAVVHNCSAYKDWANSQNSILIEPIGKTPAYDGKFFAEGNYFNQGNIFVFDDDQFIDGCEQAIKRVKDSSINWAGFELQTKFTYENTFQAIEKQIFS